LNWLETKKNTISCKFSSDGPCYSWKIFLTGRKVVIIEVPVQVVPVIVVPEVQLQIVLAPASKPNLKKEGYKFSNRYICTSKNGAPKKQFSGIGYNCKHAGIMRRSDGIRSSQKVKMLPLGDFKLGLDFILNGIPVCWPWKLQEFVILRNWLINSHYFL
jgi:hypothetical protein